jgi:hypothetical protein
MDLISARIFWSDLFGAYEAYLLGYAPSGAPAPQYIDYARWELSRQKDAQTTESHWRMFFRDANVRHAGAPVPATIDRASTVLDAELIGALHRRARDVRAPASAIVLAAMALAIRQRYKEDDVCIAFLVPGRVPRFEGAIGCFVQTRPFLMRFSQSGSIEVILEQARKSYFDAANILFAFPKEYSRRYSVGTYGLNLVSELSNSKWPSAQVTLGVERHVDDYNFRDIISQDLVLHIDMKADRADVNMIFPKGKLSQHEAGQFLERFVGAVKLLAASEESRELPGCAD